MKIGIKTLTSALVVAFMVVLASSPASAVTVSLEATDGLLQTAIGIYDLGGGGGGGTPPPCGPSSNIATANIVGPNGSGAYASTITTLTISTSVMLGSPPAPYIVEISLDTAGGTGPNSGTIAAGGAVTHSLRALVSVYATTGTPPSCVKGSQVCRVRATFAGTATGTASPVPPAATGDTITLSGSGNVTAVLGHACNPPFATLVNSTASFPVSDPLQLVVV